MLLSQIDLGDMQYSEIGGVIAVDERRTQISEDAFCIFRDEKGKTHLSISAVTPTGKIKYFGSESEYLTVTYISELLRREARRLRGNKEDGKSKFLKPEYIDESCLRKARPVSVINIHFEIEVLEKNKTKGDTFDVSTKINFGDTTVDHMYYDNLWDLVDMKLLVSTLKVLIHQYDGMNRWLSKLNVTRHREKLAIDCISVMCELFNRACIEYGREHKIPFYSINKLGVIETNSDRARFNKPLRDFLSFINSINLNQYITKGKIPFEEKSFIEALPPAFKP